MAHTKTLPTNTAGLRAKPVSGVRQRVLSLNAMVALVGLTLMVELCHTKMIDAAARMGYFSTLKRMARWFR
jgi:hypothetical protein